MNNSISVSIIAPIYGVENYIEKFADSVLSQSYQNIEFVFVNDGTKDNSMSVLNGLIDSKFSHLKDKIKIIDKQNGGLPAARRTGLDAATSDYVYHVDSDDWLAPDSIKKIVDEIERTSSDIVYFNLVKEYPDRSKVKRQKAYSSEQREQFIRDIYNHRAAASVCNKCFRRSLFLDHTIHTPRYGYAEDCYLTTQLIGYAKTICYLDANIYHYRKGNPGALTAQKHRKRKKEYALNFIDLYEKYCDLPRKENPVGCIIDDIVMQIGWYSILYNFKFFRQYPWLKSAVGKAEIRSGSDVWVPLQLLTKLIARFL